MLASRADTLAGIWDFIRMLQSITAVAQVLCVSLKEQILGDNQG